MDLTRLSLAGSRTGSGSDLGYDYRRFEDLNRLVSSGTLTREETRYLKILLSKSNTDLICELPVELVEQIVLHLEPKHFANCLAVSKGWRCTLLSTPILNLAARHYWPYLVQMSWKGHVTESAFLHALHRTGWGYRRREQSLLIGALTPEGPLFAKPSPHRNNNIDTIDINEYFDTQRGSLLSGIKGRLKYSHGRLAWTLGGCDIVVHDLWSKTQKTFSVPNGLLAGRRIRIEALGARLVVGSVDHLLVAWDHTTREYREKKLPGRIRHCTVADCTTAISLFGGDVLIWEFGGKLSTIPTNPLISQLDLNSVSAKTWQSNLRAIVDPYCSTTLWLASCYLCPVDSIFVLRQTVHEFTNGTLASDYVFDSPARDFYPGFNPINHPNIESQFYIQYLPDESNVIAFSEITNYCPEACYETAGVTFFDLYNRRFTYQEYEGEALREFRIRSNPFSTCDLDFRVRFSRDNTVFSIGSFQPGFNF
ncbi:hypothetical protein F4809DRAFT_640533 [Biscogniauxia mediterranea]|nr:hypothetical protein F4809DRAFT_640533 [Biscogniauxia mediterranea]